METYETYRISADGGRSWTEQMLTIKEAQEHEAAGYMVERLGRRVSGCRQE